MKYLIVFFISTFLFVHNGISQKAMHDIIYQVSTFDALMEGQYDGQTPYAHLHQLGNFGVGTFDKLDGEMIALDGCFYQVKSDGMAYPVKRSMKTPFADITFFETDQSQSLNKPLNYQQLCEYLLSNLPDEKGYYAIKVEGHFRQVKTRSVHPQEKPYPPLTDAIAHQVTFAYDHMPGTMVGTYMPENVEGVGVAGFHFHFISKDKKRGGHLLDCTTDEVQISIDYSDDLKVLKTIGKAIDNEIKPKPGHH